MAKKTTKTTSSVHSSFLEDENIVNAAAYFPFLIGPIVVYFFGQTDKKAAMHHIKYSVLMAIAAIVLIVLLKGFFANVVNIAYWVVSIYFGFKAYKGEKVQVEILDTIEEKISEKVGK